MKETTVRARVKAMAKDLSKRHKLREYLHEHGRLWQCARADTLEGLRWLACCAAELIAKKGAVNIVLPFISHIRGVSISDDIPHSPIQMYSLASTWEEQQKDDTLVLLHRILTAMGVVCLEDQRATFCRNCYAVARRGRLEAIGTHVVCAPCKQEIYESVGRRRRRAQ